MQKYLVISKKSSTFAAAFNLWYQYISTGSPKKSCNEIFWGKAEARVAITSAERSVGASSLPNAGDNWF